MIELLDGWMGQGEMQGWLRLRLWIGAVGIGPEEKFACVFNFTGIPILYQTANLVTETTFLNTEDKSALKRCLEP